MRTITTIIKYAYPTSIVLLPNVNMGDGGFKNRIGISYELKDDNNVFLEYKNTEHYSDEFEAMQTQAEYMAWYNENLDAMVAADKLELAGYEV